MQCICLLFVLPLLVTACAATAVEGNPPDLRRQVWETELAFAATMAARDHDAFAAFLSEHAIFVSGAEALRGKARVAEAWRAFFEAPAAPFRWEPDLVEVSATGDLALSSGPVLSASGEVIGRFNSIWRLEHGVWRVVFDKGS